MPFEISSRKMSPVEIYVKLNFSTKSFDWVPFPAPGGPNNAIFNIYNYFYKE